MIDLKLSEATQETSKRALILSVFCLLAIASMSIVDVAYGSMGSLSVNEQVAQSAAISHNYQVWTSSSQGGTPGVGCVEPLTSARIGAYYSEPYCYGHDEASLGFISNRPGSGGNAVLNFTLPSSTLNFPQGEFYGAIWFGGIVYDPSSLDSQAFMELQFYPASPQYVGPGSGSKDCTSQGFFYNNSTLGLTSNQWFACLFVFAVNATSKVEYIPYFAALDSPGTLDSAMVLSGNDLVSVNMSGHTQSPTQPLQISLKDYTSAQQSAVISLQNGTSIFSPYYDVSSADSVLLWGAAQSPAVVFAFEIGHSLSNDCKSSNFTDGGIGGVPGDGTCDSYKPGLWAQTGLIHISSPVMGTTPGLPSQISFDSSQGGVSEVYNSSEPLSKCKAPSFSASTNCIYPFYVYEYNTSSFVFLSSIVSGDVNDYGNAYEFPGTLNETTGQFMENVQPFPVSTITTVTSVSLSTLTSTSRLTSTTTSTLTVTSPEPAFALTVETRSPGGSALAGRTVILSNSTGFSINGTTNNQGSLLFTGLSQGSSYTASSNIDGANLSATVTFEGNSVILLESTSAQTNAISPGSPYFPFIIVAVAVIAVGSLLVVKRRRRTRNSPVLATFLQESYGKLA